MRWIAWGMLAALVVAGVGCGSDEAAPAPAARKSDPVDAGPRPAPATERGAHSLEAKTVAALDHASAVRVLRMDPGAPGQPADCRTGRCIEGHAVEAALLVRDPAMSSLAISAVRDWLADAASVDADCLPAYQQAVVFKSEGREYALLLDRHCGAYLLAVDGRLAEGMVEVPEADPLADVLLRGEESFEGDDDDAPDALDDTPADGDIPADEGDEPPADTPPDSAPAGDDATQP